MEEDDDEGLTLIKYGTSYDITTDCRWRVLERRKDGKEVRLTERYGNDTSPTTFDVQHKTIHIRVEGGRNVTGYIIYACDSREFTYDTSHTYVEWFDSLDACVELVDDLRDVLAFVDVSVDITVISSTLSVEDSDILTAKYLQKQSEVNEDES